MPSEHTEWTEDEREAWEKTYESEHGDLLYIEDHRKPGQTLDEEYWEAARYEIKYRPGYAVEGSPHGAGWAEKRIESFDDLERAESFLDGLIDNI